MRKLIDKAVFTFCALSTIAILSILFVILGFLLANGISAINLDFFSQLPKPAGEQGGGMAQAIIGSAVMVLLATLIALPIGIGAAVYLAEFGHGLFAATVRFLTDTLAGVPSIVIGIFVYTLLVLPMKRFSAIAGAIALALIMLPVIIRTTEEAIRLVPQSLREAGLALGTPRWRVTIDIVLSSARKAIATAVLVAIARIAGETAPLLFTSLGNSYFVTVLDRPMASLPVQIFTYAVSPYDDWHRQAWAATFLLVIFILTINLAVRFFMRTKY
ncbi:MAG: phosphate ABC transporter permease PstA [Acidobacteriota bacterium]